jgi:hypothetical protein
MCVCVLGGGGVCVGGWVGGCVGVRVAIFLLEGESLEVVA